MTLDEAIKHAEEVAEEKESEAQDLEYSKLDWKYEANQCSERAEEHKQLAEWLKDYKRLKEQDPTDKSNLEKICEELAAENDDLRDQLAMRDRFKQEPCEDAISRKDAEQMFRNIRCHLKPQDYKSAEEFNTRDLMLLNAEQMIHALPSVRPQEQTGHWILKRTFPAKLYDEYLNEYKCSECYRKIRCTESQLVNYPYCHCGAKMESEDKE